MHRSRAPALQTRREARRGPANEEWRPARDYLTDELVCELRLLEPRRIRYGRGPFRVFGWANVAGPQKPWKWTCKRAGIRYLTPHEAGRHGFGTETVVRQGVDLATAAKLGGWKDQTVLLRRYAHAKGLDKAAERIFGTEKTPFNGTPVTHGKREVG